VVPETVAPFAGLVIKIVGGVVSALFIVTVMDELAVLPAVSLAVAVTVCEPLATPVVTHE
jgi:hypothetical protein